MLLCMALNIRIRELRQERGLTQQQLADMVGVSHVHISGVERGVKNLNNHLMQRISEALGVRPADLISSGSGSNRERLSDVLDRLAEEDVRRVERFAKSLLMSQEEPQRTKSTPADPAD